MNPFIPSAFYPSQTLPPEANPTDPPGSGSDLDCWAHWAAPRPGAALAPPLPGHRPRRSPVGRPHAPCQESASCLPPALQTSVSCPPVSVDPPARSANPRARKRGSNSAPPLLPHSFHAKEGGEGGGAERRPRAFPGRTRRSPLSPTKGGFSARDLYRPRRQAARGHSL